MDNMRPMRNGVLYVVVALMLVAFLVISLTRSGQGNSPSMDLGQVAKLALAALLVFAIYFFVFHFQVPVLDMLGGGAHKLHPFVAPAVVALASPLVAWTYGIVAGSMLKIIRLE